MAQAQRSDDEEVTEADLIEVLRGLRTRITIVGLGGAGSNTIARLWEEGIADFSLFAANTDAQHLLRTRAPAKILLGRRITRGLGAGDLPQVGEEAAREAR